MCKTRSDGALSNPVYWRVFLLMAEGLESTWPLRSTYQPNPPYDSVMLSVAHKIQSPTWYVFFFISGDLFYHLCWLVTVP